MCVMSRVTTSHGLELGYVRSGGGSEIPIVFLHGVGSDKSVWHPQLAHFGLQRSAIAFDYPGYGESDPFPEGTTRDDFAGAIILAMNELGIDRAHICGLSLGGVIAIAINHAAPERCASLILADTFAAHPDGQAIYERSLIGSRDLPAMAEARVDALLAQPSDPRVRSEVVETMSRIDPAAYCIGAEAVWLAEQRDRAGDIGVPTLVLVGDQDIVTPPQLSRELAQMIPGARMEFISGAGHLGNLERPGEFNRLVQEFIEEAELRQ
jgi:3-oxoadipate enol-lactonase